MRIWPFAQLNDWADHKRRSRELRTVATWEATTEWHRDGKPNGFTDTHVVFFVVDGNGRRSARIRSTKMRAAETHDDVLQMIARWEVHGTLPRNAFRVDDRPRGKLVAINGGKGAA